MGRGTAGVAAPCDDGSAVYVNPAWLARNSGVLISGGGILIHGVATFTSDIGTATTTDNDLATVPHAYAIVPLGRKVTFGIGGYAPYGLSVNWPITFAGRFVSYNTDLKTFYVQPTVAYALNDAIAIGGGVTVVSGKVTLHRREDLARVPLGTTGLTFGALVDNETDFVDTTLSSSWGHGVGANVGASVTLGPAFRVGVSYLTRVSLDFNGRATFQPAAGSVHVTKPNPLGLPVGTPLDPFVAQAQSALQDQPAATAFDMPAQFVVGVSGQASERLTLLADYQWVGWSAFKTVTLEFSNPLPPTETLVQNYRDTGAMRLGTEYVVKRDDLEPAGAVLRGIRLRGGYFFNQAAAPDENVTPLLPEAKRHHLTAGVSIDFGEIQNRGTRPRPGMSSHWSIDLAYQYVHHADRRGRTVNPPAGELPTTALNSGVYGSRSDLFSMMVTFRP